jgi:serine/threonine-protein kinase
MSAGVQHRDLLLCSIVLEKNLVSTQELEAALGLWRQRPEEELAETLLTGGFLSSRGHERLQTLIDQALSGALGSVSPGAIFETLPTGVRAVLKGAQPQIDDEDSVDYQTIDSSGGPPTTCFTAPPPVTAVPRFHDLRPFAEGGLGEVFLAEDSEVRRTVALKQIKKRWADDEESRTRFLQEAQITGRLEHPGIVPVYALGTDETGRPYYAMRFIQGHSLQQAIERFHSPGKLERQSRRERLLGLRKLLDRFVDVCNAMEYAHSRDIIHRDLKPSNIMLGAYGETFVVDWGLAKILNDEQSGGPITIDPFAMKLGSGSTNTHLGMALGTPAYMSPEQAAGKLDALGPATDIYSLGATLFHMLTGQAPSADQDAQLVSPREAADWVPRGLSSICLQAMARHPEQRYESARALSDDVQRWLADERVLAHQERWIERAGRWMRNHRTLVACVVVAQTLVIAAILAIWLVLGF